MAPPDESFTVPVMVPEPLWATTVAGSHAAATNSAATTDLNRLMPAPPRARQPQPTRGLVDEWNERTIRYRRSTAEGAEELLRGTVCVRSGHHRPGTHASTRGRGCAAR